MSTSHLCKRKIEGGKKINNLPQKIKVEGKEILFMVFSTIQSCKGKYRRLTNNKNAVLVPMFLNQMP